MKRIENEYWVFYVDIDRASKELDKKKCGKWMYFFNDVTFADKMVSNAVKDGIVVEAKRSNALEGVCCFYLNIDDVDTHKKVIKYFLDNNLIQKTKSGRLFNISFKLDTQTLAGQYRGDFKAELKLSDFIDLQTGLFIK